jgi:hypothetical protein
MADHVRQQIRQAAASVLTGLTSTGPRVFKSRIYALDETELPALRIYTNNEDVEATGNTIGVGAILDRTLNLTVEAVAKANANLDDALDTMTKEVEMALAANYTLNGLVKSVDLTGIDIELSAEAEKPTGQATIKFRVNYFTDAGAPDISI